MAQYKHNFYGTSYYGETNAFSGTYETDGIFTEEPLKDTVDINILAKLPEARYGYDSPEINESAGIWADSGLGYISTNDPGASIEFRGTCDRVVIEFEKRSTGSDIIHVDITTTVAGGEDQVRTETFSAYSTSIDTEAEYVIDNLEYGMQTVSIRLDASNGEMEYFNFKGIRARVTHFTVETKGYGDAGSTEYTQIPISKTETENKDSYIIEGTSPNYAGYQYVQVRVWMASSDHLQTPELEWLETIAGNSNNRTEDGQWEAIVDMEAVATGASKTFQEIDSIDWVATVPDTTEMIIRTSSSQDNLSYSKVSVPYQQGVNRLRLKEGYEEGWIDVPYISPGSGSQSGSSYTRILQWGEWDDQAFLPPDNVDTWIRYSFMDTNKDELNAYHVITKDTNDFPSQGSLRSLDNKDFYLRIRMYRRQDKETPVVDFINLSTRMEYKEDKVIDNVEFSAVDNSNKGEKRVLDMSSLSFDVPPEVNSPIYELIDQTGRPQDVGLYLYSEKESFDRTNKTGNASDEVWAVANVREIGENDGLRKHYQYGGGAVKYPDVNVIEMAPTFTPSLESGVRYRYHLKPGWPDVYHVVQEGETLQDISINYQITIEEIHEINEALNYDNNGNLMRGQEILIPNDSLNPDVSLRWGSDIESETDKSAHNARIEGNADLSSDTIEANVIDESLEGEVDWVSGEKIYNGVVNLNDVRSEYKRKHAAPRSGFAADTNYIVVSGDTFGSIAKKFGIYEQDLRIENGAREGEEPIIGEVISVPSRIVLPAIDPRARVSDNPYKIDIVYNSVKKQDGTIIDESFIVPAGLDISYREVLIEKEKVTRGPVANGKDILGKPRVREIVQAESADGMIIYNPYDSFTQSGDFGQDGNYIDWGITSAASAEPTIGEEYYVTYKCEVPDTVTVTIDTTYQEEGGVDRIWRSTEVKEFEGMCSPGEDFKIELPDLSSWQGAANANIEDLEHVVEDTDLWVKTWIQHNIDEGKYYLVGSLQDRIPKDNWFPRINTGYYYLGEEEYFLYNEPVVIEPTEQEMAMAKNVTYGDGKHKGAVYLEKGSVNHIRNSGFEVASSKSTVYKLTF